MTYAVLNPGVDRGPSSFQHAITRARCVASPPTYFHQLCCVGAVRLYLGLREASARSVQRSTCAFPVAARQIRLPDNYAAVVRYSLC